MDHVELTDLHIDTIIGILDREQRRTQPIVVDLEMGLSLHQAAETGLLHTSINYADVQAWLTTLAQQGRWRLLESLATAACRLLLAPRAPCESRGAVQQVRIRIRKPTILDGAVPGVAMTRDADWCDLGETQVADGVVLGTLCATPTQGAWRLVLQPGATWAVPATWSLHVLGGDGTVDGDTIHHGDVVARAPGRTVVAGADGLALLAVGSPA